MESKEEVLVQFGGDFHVLTGADKCEDLCIRGKKYIIKYTDLRTEGHLISWIYRLCQEEWFTTRHAVQLIERFEDVRGTMTVGNLPSMRYANPHRQAELVARLCAGSRYAVESELG